MPQTGQGSHKGQVARLLAGMLKCDRCVVYGIDRDLEAVDHISHDGNPGFVAAYNRVRHLDPLRPGNFARRPEQVVVTGWNFDTAELRRSDYYEDFMRPLGQAHKAELFFRNAAGRLVAGARISRQSSSGGFSEHEVSLLHLAQPVIESHLLLTRGRDFATRKNQFTNLTERERAVAEAAAQGLSNKEICLRLGTSLPTVKSQLAAAFRKLSVRGRAELVALYALIEEEGGI